jgi:hypothetical protein
MRILPVLIASGSVALFSLFASAQQPTPQADKCAALAKMEIPNVAIATAQPVAAGEFSGPRHPFTGADLTPFYKTLPAFCRIVAKAHPSSDSDITIEVWMPLDNWNGKLQGLANGGFAGAINFLELGASLKHGYVATGTDTGHTGSPIDAAWALGHPEKIIDFGYRGIHEMTRIAKLVSAQYYGSAPKRSYFAGCSDGGREALMEAQRFPEDYDGILAGAPANYWTGLLSLAVVDTQAVTATPASFIPPAKITTIGKAVVAACDKLDGVADGVLNDPRQCRFDPASIQCKEGEDSNACLTAPQVTALKTIYAGLHDASGRTIFPGYLPGGEEGQGGWALWITGPAPAKSLMAYFGLGYYSNMVYDQKDWDYKTFALDSGMKTAKEKTAAALDATNPDLSQFRKRGGQADPLPRLERSGHPCAQHGELLRRSHCKNGQVQRRFLHPPLHGSGHAALWRWSRSGRLWRSTGRNRNRSAAQYPHHSRELGREGNRAVFLCRFKISNRQRARCGAPALPLPAIGKI